jgi:hypothetical protein
MSNSGAFQDGGPISLYRDLWNQIEAVRLIRRADGRVFVELPFPHVIALSNELEHQASGPVLRRAGNYLMFTCANGRARYRLLDRRSRRPAVEPHTGESLWQLEAIRGATVASS